MSYSVIKVLVVRGNEALQLFLDMYRDKLASVGNHNTAPVKSTGTWRKKRHLKKLYRLDGYCEYSEYKAKIYEIILSPLESDKHTHHI